MIEFATEFEYVQELQEGKSSDFCHESCSESIEAFGIVGLDFELAAEL